LFQFNVSYFQFLRPFGQFVFCLTFNFPFHCSLHCQVEPSQSTSKVSVRCNPLACNVVAASRRRGHR